MIRRRVVRVPASSANLGPGFDCMAAALALHLELEVLETGRVRRGVRAARGQGARKPLRQGVRAAAPSRRLHLQDPLADPPRGRPGIERRGDRRRPDGGRPPVRAGRRPARAGQRARGPPRQRRGRAARRVRGLRRRAGQPLRPSHRIGGAGRGARVRRCARRPRARCCPRRSRSPTPCSTSRTARC